MKIFTKVFVPNLHKNKEYFAARKWCSENFGVSDSRAAKDPGRPWYATRQWVNGPGYMSASYFHFRNPAHATMFQLVWAK